MVLHFKGVGECWQKAKDDKAVVAITQQRTAESGTSTPPTPTSTAHIRAIQADGNRRAPVAQAAQRRAEGQPLAHRTVQGVQRQHAASLFVRQTLLDVGSTPARKGSVMRSLAPLPLLAGRATDNCPPQVHAIAAKLYPLPRTGRVHQGG